MTLNAHHRLLALVSGALLALSFPKFGHPALAWIALAPLLVALAQCRTSLIVPHPYRRGFFLGLLSGAVSFAGLLYWLIDVMAMYGGLSWIVAAGVTVLLLAYLSLFPAAFGLATALVVARLGQSGLLLAPALWVSTELGRTYVLGGFPWELLGYSQVPVLPVAQLASVLGVYGLSGLVVLVNVGIVLLAAGRGRLRWIAPGVAVVCLSTTAAWGAARLADGRLTREGTLLRVGLLQGNVLQEHKWDPTFRRDILKRYLAMAREAAADGARLVLWPESATPFYLEEDLVGRAAIGDLARETGTYQLIGSDQIEHTNPVRYYNAAFLVEPDGSIGGVYRKVHLVPFGEYVPLGSWLSFVSPLVESVSDFSPGQEATCLPLGPHRVSTAICYEVVFPRLIGQFVSHGSELLTTVTNDAWYGRSSAPHQHFEQAALRAIEQGRYLARAANTGISGIVDPYGRVVARSAIFQPAVMVGDVRLLSDRTIYSKIGDLFAYLCLALTGLVIVTAWRPERPWPGRSPRSSRAGV